MTRFQFLIAVFASLCACAEPATELADTADAVTGNISLNNCTNETRHIVNGVARMRMAIHSSAFEQCVRIAYAQNTTIGNRATIGPYRGCAGDPGGTTVDTR